jgi:hypothetical protein
VIRETRPTRLFWAGVVVLALLGATKAQAFGESDFTTHSILFDVRGGLNRVVERLDRIIVLLEKRR